MAAAENEILVPKPDQGSYNPKRAAGKLLQSQAQHIREALVQHLKELAEVLVIDPGSLKTEGDIGAYVQRATEILHTHAPRAAKK